MESATVPVNAKIDETLSISVDGGPVNLGILSSGISTKDVTVTVEAVTDEKNYNLIVKDSDENTGLYLGGNAATANKNVIPAKAGLTAGTTGWGVRAGTSGDWKAVTPYSDPNGTVLASGSTEDNEGKTTVQFGASYSTSDTETGTNGKLETGDYSGAVVFIAVATD